MQPVSKKQFKNSFLTFLMTFNHTSAKATSDQQLVISN